jgi:hypothetical protein
MASNLLSDVRVKIDRARSHLTELEPIVASFLAAKPFQVYQSVNLQTEIVTERLRIDREIPEEWAALIGDIIHNLRGALDILACDLVRANGRPELVKDTYFPISSSVDVFNNNGVKKIKGASQRAIDVIAALRPYKGGDNLLWRLHRLDILDKHQLIIPVGVSMGNILLDVWGRARKGVAKGTRMVLRSGEKMYPLKNDAILDTHAPYTSNWEGGISSEYTFDIAFGEGQILDGEPVLPTLQRFASHTEEIIAKITKEALDIEFILPEYEVVLVLRGKERTYGSYASKKRTKKEKLEILKKHKRIFKTVRVRAETPRDAETKALSLNSDCRWADSARTKKAVNKLVVLEQPSQRKKQAAPKFRSTRNQQLIAWLLKERRKKK